MFILRDIDGHYETFVKMDELMDYVETRHAEEGGWDWISEIKDGRGKQYGCSWSLEIEGI